MTSRGQSRRAAREAVGDFSGWAVGWMLRKLLSNLHKGASWGDMTVAELRGRVGEELDELDEAIAAGAPSGDIISECADVANVVMMLADKYRQGKS